MVSSQTKTTDLGIFWRSLEWKIFYVHLEYFTAMGYI
jgi:hypothetical protein